MSTILEDLKYSKDHEWVRLEGDLAYVGITDYAQESLGEIVYVELPEVDDELEANQEIANIESVKAASAIYNPVSGTVDSINENLTSAPESINEDSYAHHLYVLKDVNISEYEQLFDASAYKDYLKTLN